MGNSNSQPLIQKTLSPEVSVLVLTLEVFVMVIDVVCGMEIDERTARWKSEFKGKTYYFCGQMCKLEFDENPEKYVQQDNSQLGK